MQGASTRSSEVPLKLASRSVGVYFLGVGCWVLGVGCAAGSPPGPTLKRALGRPLAACFAPPWLVHLPPIPTSPPPPPKGRGREPRAAAYPLNTARGPDGVPTPSVQEDTAKRKKKFWALGVRYWALGVYGFGRWVSTTELGCWVARATCWVLGVGCWALGVGCLWRRRWVVLEDPERRQRGGSTSNAACLDLGASRVV